MRQRCQEAFSTLQTAAFGPSWASEITSFTPRKPRRASLRKKSVQKVSASEAPIAKPSTSRRPAPLTSTAMITATETMRPPPARPNSDHLAQQTRRETLLHKRLKVHHVVGPRRILGSRGSLATKTLPKIHDDHRCG